MRPVLLLILLQFSFISYSQNAFWQHEYPNTPRESINDMHFFNSKSGIIVADGGTILRMTDGTNWTTLDYQTFEHLYCISFLTDKKGWIGGAKGTLLATTNGGFNWSAVTLPSPVNVRAIHFLNSDTGFVAGDSFICKTVNNGSSWTKTSFKTPSNNPSIKYLKFFGKDTGYAFYAPGILLRTYNGGTSWSSLDLYKPYYKMEFATAKIGWALKDSGDYDCYYKTTDGGNTWVYQYRMVNYIQAHTDMQVLDTNNVYVSDISTGLLGPNGSIFYTNNGGASWLNNSASNPLPWSTVIYFVSPDTAYVGDIWGGIKRTFDKGSNWYTNPVVSTDPLAADFLWKISFLNKNNGWAMGYGYFFGTNDGGKHWRPSAAPLPNYQHFSTFSFGDSLKGWAITDDNKVYKTTNSGYTWAYLPLPGDSATDLVFYDSSFGMVCRSNSKIAITHNGGSSWNNVSFGANRDFKNIKCIDSLTWMAYATVGSRDSVYKTTDGGASWTAHYTSIWTAGAIAPTPYSGPVSTYDSLHAVTGTYYWGSWGGYNTGVYLTDNWGATWTPLKANSNASVTGLAYVDSNNIWMCSRFGSIFHYDPHYVPSYKYKPFTNLAQIIACANTSVSISVVNYDTYASTDTFRVLLKQGATVLQTPSVNSSGIISFTTPSSTGSYTLEINVYGNGIKDTLKTVVPVQVNSLSFPYIGIYNWVTNPHCIKDPVQVAANSLNALGLGYTFELHKLENGVDTVLAVNNSDLVQVTRFNSDFELYYKVNLGQGCYSSPVHYSDTVEVIVQQLQNFNPQLKLSKPAHSTCHGDTISLKAQKNIATTNSYYNFYSIDAGNNVTLLQSGSDSVLNILSLTDTTVYFARVFSGIGDCNIPDTVSTDTLQVNPIPYSNVAASLSSNKPLNVICDGDTIILNATTATSLNNELYNFYLRSGSNETLLQSDTLSSYAFYNAANHDTVYCRVMPTEGCYIEPVLTDTIGIIVNPAPPLPVISVIKDTLIVAQIPGATYNWYFDGNLIASNNSNYFIATNNGNYTVRVLVNGCQSGISGPYLYTSVDVSHKEDNSFTIYPNPASTVLNIVSNSNIMYNIAIKNIHGQLLFSQKHIRSQKLVIPVSGFAAGSYLLLIESEEGIFRAPFIRN